MVLKLLSEYPKELSHNEKQKIEMSVILKFVIRKRMKLNK